MLISMWMIKSELQQKYRLTSCISDGSRCIRSARLFTPNELDVLSPDYVYLANTKDFFAEDDENTIVLVNGADAIIIANSSMIDILNDLVIIIDKYKDMDDRIKLASIDSKPFQKMLDIMHEEFRCPMFFGQKDMNIFAITSQYPENMVYPGWDDVVKLNAMPLYFLQSSSAPNMDAYPDELDVAAIAVTDREEKYFNYQIRANVYFHGELWGHLYIYSFKEQIPESDMQLARYFADCYGALLNRLFEGDSKVKYEEYAYLAELIDGNHVEHEKANNLYWQKKWTLGQKLRLYRITFEKHFSDIFYDFCLVNIKKTVSTAVVFPYRGSVLIVDTDFGKEADRMPKALGSILQREKNNCGVSFPFEDLQNLQQAYFQCSFAIEHAKKWGRGSEIFLYYDDCPFSGMITYFHDNLNSAPFIEPALFELAKLDRETGTEYFKTLFVMLSNSNRASDAAKKLYIHRNTLKYRLDKIRQILDRDISNNDVAAYLLLCYALLADEYKDLLNFVSREQTDGAYSDREES